MRASFYWKYSDSKIYVSHFQSSESRKIKFNHSIPIPTYMKYHWLTSLADYWSLYKTLPRFHGSGYNIRLFSVAAKFFLFSRSASAFDRKGSESPKLDQVSQSEAHRRDNQRKQVDSRGNAYECILLRWNMPVKRKTARLLRRSDSNHRKHEILIAHSQAPA